ncbi:glycosyltransferase family 4 protein [Halococcus agarilyticus]|uniref:glycosyltransferase family 4 protein n=1 Tax=Halococcus agarilyticus TaxID=1232219 RepID=UPI0006778512|nr:glycosyltransferase family 4 protein [Halococcus agarilyticus]
MSATEPDVLHVITRSDWGGAPRIVNLLAAEAAANTAVACGTGGKLIDELRARDIPVFEQPSLRSPPGPADARAFVDLYRLLRRESFDLVHCHSTKAGMLGRSAAKLAGTPTVFTVHGWGFYNTGYDWAAPIVTRSERLLARSTDAIVCVSENDLAEGRERGIIQHTHSTVIHNGVPPVSVPADRRTLFEEAGIEPGTVVVGAIARLVDQKNPIGIVRIAGELQKRGHDATAVLIGDGPLAADCERYADEHGIEIHLLGFRERALELLLDFDVFVLPSRFEGFPLTVLESLHAGVPVVAYDVGGVGEAIVDGETGFVVAPGDATAFVDRVERLVTDADRRDEMGNRAEAVAASAFTAQRMAAEYDRLYADVLDRA